MVHVTTPRPSIGSAIGQAIGSIAGQEAGFQRGRSRLQQGLANLRNVQPGANPSDILASLVEASYYSPQIGKALGPLYESLLAQNRARGSQNVNYDITGGGINPAASQVRERQPVEAVAPQQQLPEFGQTNPFFPSNVGKQEQPGNLPQAATSGLKRPVLSETEMLNQARRIAAEETKNGNPTTVPQALEGIRAQNQDNIAYNEGVEKERKERVATQREYGEKSAAALQKVLPDATDEQLAVFRKKGEDIAGRHQSEADIERSIAKEAIKFKNQISSVRSSLSAPRIQNKLQRKFLGTDKDFQAAAKDLKTKLDPLLKEGLYDTSRKLLSEIGYYPEEIESVVSPLNTRAQNIINSTPSVQSTTKSPFSKSGKDKSPFSQITYGERQRENLRESLREIFKNDPNSSVVLLRKGFEDKNYDWRVFKDVIDDMIASEEFVPTDDQRNQLNYLETPPLNNLEKVLHGLNLIGR